jgi:hypothetical protein
MIFEIDDEDDCEDMGKCIDKLGMSDWDYDSDNLEWDDDYEMCYMDVDYEDGYSVPQMPY